MSFIPKSIDDINDDFLKDMQEKYSVSSIEPNKDSKEPSHENKKSKTVPKEEPKAGKEFISPFDAVRPIVVIDENNNARVVTKAQLNEERAQGQTKAPQNKEPVKETPKESLKTPAPKAPKKAEPQAKKQAPQNKETVKETPKESLKTPAPKAPKKAEPQVQKQTPITKGPVKTEQPKEIKKAPVPSAPQKAEPQVQKQTPITKSPVKTEQPKETAKKSVPTPQALKENDSSQHDDTYTDYLAEFLDILTSPDPQKREEKRIVKKETAQKNAVTPAPKVNSTPEETKVQEQLSKKLEDKMEEQYQREPEEIEDTQAHEETIYPKNSASLEKEQRIRKLFISGCILLITSLLSIAILFTMSKFIPAKEIVEQSKKNEEVVQMNNEGNPQYSNETRIDCSFVESYSFSAFINTYYLHWVIVLAFVLLGASIFCFCVYVRERGPGKLFEAITYKIKNKDR